MESQLPRQKKQPVIALLSDFGLADNFVGVMKGVIAHHCPQANVIDITHAVPPHSILHPALALMGAYKYFPRGTIFLTVVDPGVGSGRRIIAVAGGGMTFVAPDNGVLYPLLSKLRKPSLWEITWRPTGGNISATFHGRDIFAPVAAMLARGVRLDDIARRIRSIEQFEIPGAETAGKKTIRGEVIYIDNFGNVMTSISRGFLAENFPACEPDKLVAELGKTKIREIRSAYADARPGSPVLVFNSYDMLEIAINRGNAAKTLSAKIGAKLKIRI